MLTNRIESNLTNTLLSMSKGIDKDARKKVSQKKKRKIKRFNNANGQTITICLKQFLETTTKK